MKSKADLFQLIKAMSKSEKRYFTLDAQKSGRKDARYLELFQAINEMETYDESPLKEKFGKTLPADKAYLYEAILRSMRDYRSANSYTARIKEMIMDAKYLYERGLYDQSEERLNAAKELAQELGDQLSAIELNKEQRRLLKDTKRKGYEQEIEKLIEEKTTNLKKLEEELFYLDIHDDLLLKVRRNAQQLNESQKEILRQQYEILASADAEKEPSTIQGKLRFYQCMALLHQLLDNPNQVRHYYLKIITCWDAHSKYKEEEFYRYILDVSNLIHISLSNPSKSDQLSDLIAKLERERPSNLNDQKVLFQRVTSYRLLYSINTGDFPDIKPLLLRIEKGLKQYDIPRMSEIGIILNVSFLLFMSGHYDLCQTWAEKIIQYRKLNVRQDIENASRLLYLLASIEIDAFEKVEANFRNILRYFQKLNMKKTDALLKVLRYLKKLYIGSPSEEKQTLKQLKEYVRSLSEKKDNIPLGLDELLLYWIESKLSKRNIAEVVKIELARNRAMS